MKLKLSQAIVSRGREAQLHHLHSVGRLSGGRRSRGLDLGGIDGLPFWGPSPWLVSLERVGPGLNAPQAAPVTDVHLLWSHLFTAGPLEAWATHTGMWPAAGATVLAGGLAVSWRESTDGDQVFSGSCYSMPPPYEGAVAEKAFPDLNTGAHFKLIQSRGH